MRRLPWRSGNSGDGKKTRKPKKKYSGHWETARIGDHRVRCGEFEIRVVSERSFRALHWEIFLKRVYHFETSNPSPVIVDCGGNIGMAMLYFKHTYPQARIVSFEPGKEPFTCLQENIERNQLENVTAHNVALGDRTGEVDFFSNPGEGGDVESSTRAGADHWEKSTVSCARLSDYIDEPVDYLKIDTEGAELAILEDLEEAGKLELIRAMGIEYHHHLEPHLDQFGRFLSILERAGFGYSFKRPPFDMATLDYDTYMDTKGIFCIDVYRKKE